MNTVSFNNKDICVIKKKDISALKRTAASSTGQKARLCLHKDEQALIHEMIIAFSRDVYIRPHRHEKKIESFHILEGSAKLIIFGEEGNTQEIIALNEKNSIVRLEKNIWHTLIPLTKYVVVHETTNGPYTGINDSTFAKWAPRPEASDQIAVFKDKFLKTEKES